MPGPGRLQALGRTLREVGWPVWLFAIACVADLASTGLLFSVYGSEVELHPVIRWLGACTGPWPAAVGGKAGQLAGLAFLALVLSPRALRLALVVAGSAYALAAIANLYQYLQA